MKNIVSVAVALTAGMFLSLLTPALANSVVDASAAPAPACTVQTDGTPATLADFQELLLGNGMGEAYVVEAADLVKDVDAMNTIGEVPAGYEHYLFAFADPRTNPDLQVIAVYIFDTDGCTFNVIMVDPAMVLSWIDGVATPIAQA